MADTTSALYVYCIVSSTRQPSVARVPAGLSGASRTDVHPLVGSLWLVSAEVPLDIYAPANLEPRLRDLDWVSSAAVAHEAVIEHFSRARGAVVVPTKLFTMFSSLERALEETARRRRAIECAMRHIAGCEEWGVRIARRPAAAVSRRSSRPEARGRRPGAAFLEARKDARDAAAAARADAFEAADEAFDRLRRRAKDAHRRDRRPEPGTNPPILEAAFLVPAAGRARFKAEAKRQARAVAGVGADLALTGPWPAYNFVGLADEERA
ncbi:MAG TPA: GvpL/GvpF family gas vesicle protein [Vicinamibacterales bacterium]|nr:GvpL/GvpF family gas vesicle protein [Vicinamibacterales bacterium]